jgi:ribosomal protein S18 acetylase RimI-like enzyme
MNDILTDLSSPALAAAAQINLHAFFRQFGRAPQVEFLDGPDLARWHTSIPHPWFNGVLCLQPPGDRPGQRVAETIDYFTSRQVGVFTWWLAPGLQILDWEAQLQPAGFQYTEGPPGMGVDLADLPWEAARPPGLEIRPVEDSQTLQAWAYTFLAGYEFPDDFADVFASLLGVVGVGLPFQHYLGFLEGQPAATASLFLAAGAAGIYNVATLPAARRRGLGGAMTLAALQTAREMGYRAGVLQSSESGFPVYQRLGFRQVCTLEHFYWTAEV